MEKYGYVAMILFTIVGSFWLEVVFKVGVLRRWKRAFSSILPISMIFIGWDAYAIKCGHWFFDRNQILGIFGPFGIPIEEYAFFIFVPVAALMTIEAVVKVKPHWARS
jgi:lycopene cyclase domain-containing protein